ncbi:nuA3 HAT complex component nto1 [Mortierella claussenii]|nr:nuA3 HAT complex component nto1 [Mortierella claussenii]
MPHINPPAPPMPRLEPPESDQWWVKVKAVPFYSPNFNCILPGCPNSYQTKQGLERHFMSIHMPKSEKHPRAVDARSAAAAAASAQRKASAGTRKGRIKSHRKGRPPGSGLKARLKQQEIQQASGKTSTDDHLHHLSSDIHTNHSLLANHPASTRHDYGGDDENKPREERSYLEFFPFLNTSLRLEIVDSAVKQSEGGSTDVGTVVVDRLVERQHSNMDATAKVNADTNVTASAGDDVSVNVDANVETVVDTDISTRDDAGTNVHTATNPVDAEADIDADAGSDPDVFFDAKGFIDGETELSQKQNGQLNKDTPGAEGGSNGVSEKDGDAALLTEMDIKLDASLLSDSGSDWKADTTNQEGEKLSLVTSTLHTDTSGSEIQTGQGIKNENQPAVRTTLKALPPTSAPTSVLEPKTPMALLPKSSFRLITREDDDLEEYHLPAGHNVRYIEPTETELAERVEYDMDEQDEFWLKEINEERRKQDLGEVTATVFERIIDRLEKEWFDLTKNIPKSTENLPPEDSACNICDDGECENSNAIVFCDGCNLAVHQDCYGIPYIPEGQWLCRKCMLSPQMPVSCIFCPGEGGAFKQTTNSRWAHLLCASWIPEVGVANTVYMEPIDNIDKIPASRWRLTCYICKLRMGACIQCETKNCFRAFHVTCARKAHLYMKSKLSKASNAGGEVLIYRAHCHKHTPRDHKGAVDIAGAAALFANKGVKKKRAKVRAIDDDSDDPDYGRSDEDEKAIQRRSSLADSDKGATTGSVLAASQVLGGSRTSKAALAHQKHYSSGAPLAPTLIVNRLLPFVSKLGAKSPALRKVSALNFIYTICKYWSLKRESRRGAPLLKRLHLEPWTASASAHRQTEEEKLKKLQTQLLLRGDLEKVRMLAELVRKRERAKLKRQECQNRYLSKIMFPLKTILEETLAELEKLDRQQYFAYPISADEVKDYHDVIKDPICFQTMNEKLAAHKYQTVEEFAVDTPYYRAASRQIKQAEPLLEKAKEDYEHLEIDPQTGFLAVPIDPEIFTYNLTQFQKSEDDGPTAHISSPLSAAPTATGSSNLKRRDMSVEPAKAPFVTSRSLRATAGRTTQAATTSLPPSPQDIRRGLNQSPGFRAPAKAAARPEVPKLKTATLTRADVARARQAGSDGGVEVTLDEEELLEKLKHKSKKSRSLAVSLQSRLKPSIVDKAVVINKPAPKGWAYVVVEGEEDTTEGEDEGEAEGGSQQGAEHAEALELEKAKEELRLQRKQQRLAIALKKKLAKAEQAKLRAAKYAQMKALKAQAAAGGAAVAQDARKEGDDSAAVKTALGEDLESDVLSTKQFKSRSRRTHSDTGSQGAGLTSTSVAQGMEEHENRAAGPSIVQEDTASSEQKRRSTSPMEGLGVATEGTVDSIATTGSVSPSTERSLRSKGKQIDWDRDFVNERFEKLEVANEDAGHRSVDDDGDSDKTEAAAEEEEPPRKRQKRGGTGRMAAKDDTEHGATTRRLRSTEAAPQTATQLGSRRSSSAVQRLAVKSMGDMAGE